MKKTVILGVGNILRCDEGVGIHIVNELSSLKSQISNLDIIDGGTLGVKLIPFIENVDKLIIIDAVKNGGTPGTVYKWLLKSSQLNTKFNFHLSLHQIDLIDALKIMEIQNKLPREIIIIGVEPEKLDWGCELSESVSNQKEKILKLVMREISNDIIGRE